MASRVLYSFPHVLGRAGIAETALQQVLGLARRNVEITLFCASRGGVSLPRNVKVVETLVFLGRRIPHRALGVQNAYGYHDRRVAAWLGRHHREVDIAHVWPRGCLRTLRTAARVGLPAVRESPNPHTASVMRESLKAGAHAGVILPRSHSHASNAKVLARERAEYDAATAVLVPSPYAYGEFVAEGFPTSRLLQHRYGCDLERFSARPETAADDRRFRAVFVGRGDPTKGLHVALEAWRQAAISNGEFLVAGRIIPEYRSAIAAGLALPGVRELGFVDDVPSLLRSADVLVLPSWTEGSALVILEAEASGCVPLVSTASGTIGVDGREVLLHSVADTGLLARQLRRLAANPQELAMLSAYGSARREELGWDAAAAALIDCYSAAIDASKRPTPPRAASGA